MPRSPTSKPVAHGVLWILDSGAKWRRLQVYPEASTIDFHSGELEDLAHCRTLVPVARLQASHRRLKSHMSYASQARTVAGTIMHIQPYVPAE